MQAQGMVQDGRGWWMLPEPRRREATIRRTVRSAKRGKPLVQFRPAVQLCLPNSPIGWRVCARHLPRERVRCHGAALGGASSPSCQSRRKRCARRSSSAAFITTSTRSKVASLCSRATRSIASSYSWGKRVCTTISMPWRMPSASYVCPYAWTQGPASQSGSPMRCLLNTVCIAASGLRLVRTNTV